MKDYARLRCGFPYFGFLALADEFNCRFVRCFLSASPDSLNSLQVLRRFYRLLHSSFDQYLDCYFERSISTLQPSRAWA
jgi:hypothetical protein